MFLTLQEVMQGILHANDYNTYKLSHMNKMKLHAENKLPVSFKCDPFLIILAQQVLDACTCCLPVVPATPTPPALPEPTGKNLSTNVVGASASI